MLSRRMLSKDEENETVDAEVTREDQDKINAFSRLHNREKLLEEELGSKQKDKEDYEEISNELELADEDEPISYKLGDSFISIPLSEAQSMLSESTAEIETEVTKIEEKLTEIREQMSGLKVELYARFGRGINLEA